jgi:O-antigen ligase
MSKVKSLKRLPALEQSWPVFLLAAMMVVLPSFGATDEELLQDTLKSIFASIFALLSAFAFFWHSKEKVATINTPKLIWLPVFLMLYALASTAWSHTYLGGVEAVRWFIFSLIFFVGLNTLSVNRVTELAWGIHLGATTASLWAVLQFITDFQLFSQAASPASTFVNRNFFAEFLICTIPFSVLLLTKLKDKFTVFLITISLGFNIVALMMTGTRSALVGIAILLFLLPIFLFLYRKQVASTNWDGRFRIAVGVVFLATVACFGSINTKNSDLIADFGESDAIDRAFSRTLSIGKTSEYTQGSFSVRAIMWKATGRMIKDNPLFGVGAGAWEVQAPLYQEAGSQLETDYYAHNEVLQLLAEYGLVGWLFLACLFLYLLWAAFRTFTDQSPEGRREAPLRAFTLASLLMLLLVSNAGFPWRMATTGALFALSLSILTASDIRLGKGKGYLLHSYKLNGFHIRTILVGIVFLSVLAVYVSKQAIDCESYLVRAVKIAQTIAQSKIPDDPRWSRAKAEMNRLLQKGIDINPHYRKITPMAADFMASWGDWKNATWIWESIAESRPNVVAILTNIARGYLYENNFPRAQEYIERAKKIQPNAASIASLDVINDAKSGNTQDALIKARTLLASGVSDRDLLTAAYFLGIRNNDPTLAIRALEMGIKSWPERAVDGWLKMGKVYESLDPPNFQKALEAYRAAIEASEQSDKISTALLVPPKYRVLLPYAEISK